MKKILSFFAVIFLAATAASAQADRIVGTYSSVYEGIESKIKISKVDGGYRAQVVWVDNLYNPDGSLRTDIMNPDPAKRKTPANEIVLIQKISYNSKKDQWDNGRIYEPTTGKTWTVTCYLEDNGRRLRVRGSLGPIGKSLYWTRVD